MGVRIGPPHVIAGGKIVLTDEIEIDGLSVRELSSRATKLLDLSTQLLDIGERLGDMGFGASFMRIAEVDQHVTEGTDALAGQARALEARAAQTKV